MKGRIQSRSMASKKAIDADSNDELAPGEFEVGKLVDIHYGSSNKKGKRGLKFKVLERMPFVSSPQGETVEAFASL